VLVRSMCRRRKWRRGWPWLESSDTLWVSLLAGSRWDLLGLGVSPSSAVRQWWIRPRDCGSSSVPTVSRYARCVVTGWHCSSTSVAPSASFEAWAR